MQVLAPALTICILAKIGGDGDQVVWVCNRNDERWSTNTAGATRVPQNDLSYSARDYLLKLANSKVGLCTAGYTGTLILSHPL